MKQLAELSKNPNESFSVGMDGENIFSDIIQDVENGTYGGTAIDTFRCSMGLDKWIHLSGNQKSVLENQKI